MMRECPSGEDHIMKFRHLLTAGTSALVLAACGAPNRGYESSPAMAPEAAMKMAEPMYATEESATGGEGASDGSVQPGQEQYIAYMHSIGMCHPGKAIGPRLEIG